MAFAPMIKKLFFVLAAAVGGLVLLVVLSTAAVVGYDRYADVKAGRAAQMLCAAIPVGSDINAVIEAAARRGDGNRLEFYEGVHHFRFQAGLLHSDDCAVTSLDGKVVSVRVEKNDD
jgi:hypothetical protein